MAEEDKESHLDEPQEQEPIKVSVTFKPQEQEDDVKLLDTSEEHHQTQNDIPPLGDPQQVNVTYRKSENEEPRLPANPPVTPIPSYVDAYKPSSEDADQPEVLEGWKGYSNNIYIQPIIVNNASCNTFNYSTNNKPQRRLTCEDVRKQMRLREANSWITKHNERIRSTGTLGTSAQWNEKGKQEAEAKAKERKTKRKIHKGFVCRTWATKFLPKDASENEDDEFVPFFVQKYVDNSKSIGPGKKKTVVTLTEGKHKTSNHTCGKGDSDETTKQNDIENVTKLDINAKDKSYSVDEDNMEITDKHMENWAGSGLGLKSISRDSICCCGEKLKRGKEMKRCRSTIPLNRASHQRSRSKEKNCVALPIKQFPPINPLEGTTKPKFLSERAVSVSPTRSRPHTVDSALLSKEALLVNGHRNLPNYVKASYSFNGVMRLSPENLNREKQMFSRIAFERECVDSKKFDEAIKLMRKEAGKGEEETSDKNETCKLALHEDKNVQVKSARSRSLSDPRGSEKWSRRRIGTLLNSIHGNEDDESHTDSNNNSLGSEIEYTFDGSAKLAVYLHPRGDSCH